MEQGKMLKKLARQHGLTQQDVADQMGVHIATVKRWYVMERLPDTAIAIVENLDWVPDRTFRSDYLQRSADNDKLLVLEKEIEYLKSIIQSKDEIIDLLKRNNSK